MVTSERESRLEKEGTGGQRLRRYVTEVKVQNLPMCLLISSSSSCTSRILQYRRLPNGEWIEFEPVAAGVSISNATAVGASAATTPTSAASAAPAFSAAAAAAPGAGAASGAGAGPSGAAAAGRVPGSGAPAGVGAASVAGGQGAVTAPDSLATLLAPRLAPVAWFRFYTRDELRRREATRLTAQVCCRAVGWVRVQRWGAEVRWLWLQVVVSTAQ